METEIPSWVYVAVGTFVISNFGTLYAVYRNSNKAAYRTGYRDAEVDFKIKEAKDTGVRAHQRIDKIPGAPG